MIAPRGEKKSSSLYLLQVKLSKDIINAVKNDNTVELWHKMLGHMSEKGMKLLAKKNFLSRIKSTKLKKCVYCMIKKQTRVSFKNLPSS